MGSKAQEGKPWRGEGLQPLTRGFITALARSRHAVCSPRLLLYPSCLPASSIQHTGAIKATRERGSSTQAPGTSPQLLGFPVTECLSWSPSGSWKPGLAWWALP